MNGSRNTSHKRKNRHRSLMMLILLALAAVWLVQAGIGQQATVRNVDGSKLDHDRAERQQLGETSDIGFGSPPTPRLTSGTPTPVIPPIRMQLTVGPRTEKSLLSDLPDRSPGSAPGYGILRGQQNQDATQRLIRLPPVLQILVLCHSMILG